MTPFARATFRAEAWINDHATPVDDASWVYDVSEEDYTEAEGVFDYMDWDMLQEAGPPEVVAWPGPFTITVEKL